MQMVRINHLRNLMQFLPEYNLYINFLSNQEEIYKSLNYELHYYYIERT